MSDPEDLLAFQLHAMNIPFEREFRFHQERRYRFDFAFPAVFLAVEIEGGIWSGGAHARPRGIMRDMEKANLAASLGWAVLRFTPKQIKTGSALQEIERWLKTKSSGSA